MRNAFTILLVAVFSIFFASCHKCYNCVNARSVCQKMRYDTTLTILVSSQNLSAQYYAEYIDSLTSPSLGWICKDTTSDYAEEYCHSKTGSDDGLMNEKAKGLNCSPK